jgi:4-hydroxybenzoate polyprenyltransferase
LDSIRKESLAVGQSSRPLEVAWNVLVLLRPKHWVKNFFVFAPLLFSGRFRSIEDIHAATLSFVVFCLLASGVYTINDIVDRERDARSPSNQHRPLASGKLSVGLAGACGLVLVIGALGLAWVEKLELFVFAFLYLANNLLYTLYVKDKVIADVISIAAGFVIRVLAGAAVISVQPSQWLLVCTFSMSLLLGFGKRRAELFHARGVKFVSSIYTPEKLDHMINVSAAMALVSYLLYVVSPESVARFRGQELVYTVPFAVYGIFRFVAKIQEGKCKDPVHLLYSDKVSILNVTCWLMAVMVILARAYAP